jgi:hypothetical protein
VNKFNVGDIVEWAPGSPGYFREEDREKLGEHPGQVESDNGDGTYVVLFTENFLPMRFRRIYSNWIQRKNDRVKSSTDRSES